MDDFNRLAIEFVDYYSKLKRVRANCTFAVGLFGKYLDETGLDFMRFSVRQAQDFHSYLMTKLDDEGKIKYARYTVSHAITGMGYFYHFLKIKNLVYSNPFLQVKRVKEPKTLPKDLLNEEEMNQLLNHLKEFWKGKNLFEKRQQYRAHLVIEFLYSTGMNVTELRNVKLADVDFKRNIVRVETHRVGHRECILNDYTAKLLKIFIDEIRPLFFVGSNYKAGQYDDAHLFGSKTELPRIINRYLDSACKELKLHKLIGKHVRYVVGFHLLRGGADIRYIKDVLGHQSLENTRLFYRIEKTGLKNVLDKFHPRNFGGTK